MYGIITADPQDIASGICCYMLVRSIFRSVFKVDMLKADTAFIRLDEKVRSSFQS